MQKFLTCADSRIELAWKRVKRTVFVPTQELSFYRVVLGTYALLRMAPNTRWVDGPPAFFSPPILSLSNLFNDFPANHWFLAFDCLAVILLLGITLGVRARWCGVTLAICFFLASSFRYSYGKIDHSFLTWLAILVLSMTNWGTRFALWPDKPRRRNSTSLGLLAVALCFGFFSAGIIKALVWIDFDTSTSGINAWFYDGYYNLDRRSLLAPWMFHLPPLLAELGDYAAVAFELTGILFLLSGRFWWKLWIATACAFHLANTLFLNIPFITNAPTYALFFLYPTLRVFCPQLLRSVSFIRVLYILATLLAALRLFQIFSPAADMLKWPVHTGNLVNLVFGIILWSVLILFAVASLVATRRRGRARDQR